MVADQDDQITLLWAKTARDQSGAWHPLLLHLLDVAASADAILHREPAATRTRLGAILGLDWEDAKPWILLLIACHDLGKACPSFQAKWPGRPPTPGLASVASIDPHVNHGFVGQMELAGLLHKMGWASDLADLAADAVGCHHGNRAAERDKATAEYELSRGAAQGWSQARTGVFDVLKDVLEPGRVPTRQSLSGPDFMLLAGLTSFADWIGSDDARFTFGTPADCADPTVWFAMRRELANLVLTEIGWYPRAPLCTERPKFEQVFGFPARPLQKAIQNVLDGLPPAPGVLLIEAPMGEGKSEAAFLAHLELQRRFGHRGLYIALPTSATGNAMFERTLQFLRNQSPTRLLDLQLLHSRKMVNEDFVNIKMSGIFDGTKDGAVRAAEWFTRKKRALLSEYGVGTVDQALLPILPVRHNFVRLWGLANRVVVFDEVHAYDEYTGTLLMDLIRWLLALGSSIIVLSATVAAPMRRRMANAIGCALPEVEPPYPRVTAFQGGEPVRQWHVPPDAARACEVTLTECGADLPSILSAGETFLPGMGTAVLLVNTVQRAQELYQLFSDGVPLSDGDTRIGKELPDGTQVLLFHARYPAEARQARERAVLKEFGAKAGRGTRKFLVATQVVEQSLDLDFDLMVTDLAPIDLLLQRAGRLWRHQRPVPDDRGAPIPRLVVAGLAGASPPELGKPLWWGKVYREDLLLCTWALLKHRGAFRLPDEIELLVDLVYENRVETPDWLEARVQAASAEGEGTVFAHRQQAKRAIIGFPDDSSWNDPARFVLFDEDAPGVHRTLMAQTRLGEDSVLVIPVRATADFDEPVSQSAAWEGGLFDRAISVSRQRVVRRLRQGGIPRAWEKSSLLRNCYPLRLDDAGRWVDDPLVRLDADLGLVYDRKESE